MAYTIITTIYARRDLQDAVDWENMRKPGLGQYFLQDLESKLSAISNMPLMCEIYYKNVRCATTNIFQYLIHYVVDDTRKEIIVVRILHTSRAPVW